MIFVAPNSSLVFSPKNFVSHIHSLISLIFYLVLFLPNMFVVAWLVVHRCFLPSMHTGYEGLYVGAKWAFWIFFLKKLSPVFLFFSVLFKGTVEAYTIIHPYKILTFS